MAEKSEKVTIIRAVCVRPGLDAYEGDVVDVTPKEKSWLTAQGFAKEGKHPAEGRSLDQGAESREGGRKK